MITMNPLSRPERDLQLSLAVTVDGLTIHVKAGSFRVGGVDYALAEDVDHDVTLSPSFPTSVLGYLVRLPDGSVSVLVDEIVHDGIDRAYPFDGDIRPLHPLFHINRIPSKETDLANQEVQVQCSAASRAAEVPAMPTAFEILRMVKPKQSDLN